MSQEDKPNSSWGELPKFGSSLSDEDWKEFNACMDKLENSIPIDVFEEECNKIYNDMWYWGGPCEAYEAAKSTINLLKDRVLKRVGENNDNT